MVDCGSFSVGVIVVDYFKAKAVAKLVEQLKDQEVDCSVKICVIDNSVDDSNFTILQSIEGIKLIRSEDNLGYTKACNMGASLISSDYVAFINPDVEIKDADVLKKLINKLRNNPQVGIIGPRQVNPDGSVEQTARSYPSIFGILAKRLPLLKIFLKGSYERYMRSYDLNESQFVSWLQSSFVVMKLDCFLRIGGFDEKYFLFMADVDISKSMSRIGKQTYYCSDVNVYPDGQRASAGGFLEVFRSRVMRIHLLDYFKYLLFSGSSR